MTYPNTLDSLTRKAFDFLERGIAEFDKVPKYPVIHFFAAVEMRRKAKLIRPAEGSFCVRKPLTKVTRLDADQHQLRFK